SVTVLLSSVARVDRAGRDLYRLALHLSFSRVRAMKPIIKIISTGAIVLAALGMIAYKYLDYIKYPWTRDGVVRAQVIQIVPRLSGQLVRVPIRNNQLVKQGDLLFEIDPSTFQSDVNLARAQFDNMRDIIKSLAEQVDVMRAAVEQSEADRNQAR